MSNRQPIQILDGLGFGEGLRWHDDRLWFSDFYAHTVSSLDLAGDRRVEAELDERPSGLGWLPDGRLLVVAMDSRRVLRREPTGELVVHADLSSVATSHANDMVVAADGTVLGGPEGLAFPNGSVITPDGSTYIVGESMAQRYRAFPILPDSTLGEGRLWADLGGRFPDGCTLDADGAIWFADAMAPEVARVAEGGEVLDVIAMPDRCFACALGGPDGRTLFVATASTFPGGNDPDWSGRLWSVEVDVRHAGRP
jgi:sugar lactone lactonase YvrE